jgi:hypothetical protein
MAPSVVVTGGTVCILKGVVMECQNCSHSVNNEPVHTANTCLTCKRYPRKLLPDNYIKGDCLIIKTTVWVCDNMRTCSKNFENCVHTIVHTSDENVVSDKEIAIGLSDLWMRRYNCNPKPRIGKVDIRKIISRKVVKK